jgi:Taurine catabolism dioxygenase TauD, TfdA family/Gamma-butyrobetaine hydroxylase-like, N-terminal
MASLPARTHAAGLPAVWLRDNCRCAECLDPVTGQRLRSVTDLPAGLTVSQVAVAGDRVTVRFQPGYRRACQQAILDDGLILLGDVPAEPGMVLTVAASMGYVRETNCVVFDNTRILHGRTGFTGPGGRHLQGCYADLDGVESAVAVAGREQQEGKHRT